MTQNLVDWNELLDDIDEFLDDHSDVVDSENGPRANKAMRLLARLRDSREAR